VPLAGAGSIKIGQAFSGDDTGLILFKV
jgi:hypothetical protein